MAKAAKTATAEPTPAEAAVIPAPLAAAAEENDTVLQAHFIRQQNHHNNLAPSIAKQAREDEEREKLLQEHERIAERNRLEREQQAKEQAEREERENAASRLALLETEIADLETALEAKQAEAKRLKSLVS